MIQQTTNYEMFKKHESNREICPSNLKKIIGSISFRNLLYMNPIIVDSELRIIDGQHRLEAAKVLKIPIHYLVQRDSKTEDIVLLNNNQKKWDLKDYLNFYCSNNNHEYLKIRDYLKTKQISLNTYLILNGYWGGSSFRYFKNGKYKFPENIDMIEEKILKLKHICTFLNARISGYKLFLTQPTFTKALCMFINLDLLDFDLFLKKIEYNISWMHRCSKVEEYVACFKNIYNYKNSNPIP